MGTATIRIVGSELPGRVFEGSGVVHVGLQRRAEVVDLVRADADQAVFDVPVETVATADGTDFRGPFVHGRRGQRFLYLSWGHVDEDGTFTMFRRAKLNLPTLPTDVVDALTAGRVVRADLGLTDARGGPICASIPPASIRWRIEAPS